MATTRKFSPERRGVAFTMASALLKSVTVLSIAALTHSGGTPPTFSERLQFGLRADLLVIDWVVAAIGNVARLRFFSERDIAGSSEESGSENVRVAGAILQNTFEQTFLAIITHLILIATFARSNALIVTLVIQFAAGRLLFWMGVQARRTGARVWICTDLLSQRAGIACFGAIDSDRPGVLGRAHSLRLTGNLLLNKLVGQHFACLNRFHTGRG